MKSKLEVYALSVCFSAIVCLVISLGIGSYSIVSITAPSLTMQSYFYDTYQSNDNYWLKHKPYCKDDCDKIVKPSEAELTKQRFKAFDIAKEGERRKGFQSLMKCSLFILFSALALFIHWKIAKKCREPDDGV